MELKGTLALIQEGWHLFYRNLGVVWKQAQFSFWMGLLSTIVLAGSLGFWTLGNFIITAANSTATTSPSVGLMILNILCAILGLASIVAIIIFTMSYSIAFTKTLAQLQSRQEINTKDKYQLVLPILGISLLTGLIMFGGFLLLLIPGIIFWIWFAFSTFARMVDNKKGLEALHYSRSLSKGRFWKVLGRILLINIILGIISIIIFAGPQLLGAIIAALGDESATKAALLVALFLAIPIGIIFMILQVLFPIFMVAILMVFYFNLKETWTIHNPVHNTSSAPVVPSMQ